MLPDEKKPSKFLSTCLGLWGLPDDLVNHTVEAFASHLPKLWTEGLNWIVLVKLNSEMNW